MRIVRKWQGWARASNERAVGNAREATTALSRARVEREEVELYLAGRHAVPTGDVVADVRVAGGAR